VKCSLDHDPREAPWFYSAYTIALVGCAYVVASGVNLVSLSVGVQVMNALLLPPVLGFLYLLARRLPEPHRCKAPIAWSAPGYRHRRRLRRLFRRGRAVRIAARKAQFTGRARPARVGGDKNRDRAAADWRPLAGR